MNDKSLIARHITISGRVQGIGFRPFVSSLAKQLNLFGWVRNEGGLVKIWVEGNREKLEYFKNLLLTQAPLNTQIKHIKVDAAQPQKYSCFTINESKQSIIKYAQIPQDYSICKTCFLELNTPTNRRYQYPFINCTQCGPRYTLIKKLPYDRSSTSMVNFEMCESCITEYKNPIDRRYHAQTLSCPECGPSLSFKQDKLKTTNANEALRLAIISLHKGHILAIKGIGGYHLCCLATSEKAVNTLRKKKSRALKPFAVMLRSNESLKEHAAKPSESQRKLLNADDRPIVLIEKNKYSTIANAVAPGLNEIGFMLPYTALQHLLLQGVNQPIVITSANISGDAILLDNNQVESKMEHIADAFLHHDIEILRTAEDSVYSVINNNPLPFRLGRGITPLEFDLPITLANPLVALGGHFKNTIALAWDNRIVISPHIGDLTSPRSMQVFEDTISQLSQLYGVSFNEYVCDAHPDYNSHRWAKANILKVNEVFHHYAHASALYAEKQLSEDVLFFTWDGTGYGEDATLWGGEGLYGKPGNWERVSSIKPFRLIGGYKATTEPWRTALSACWEIEKNWMECPFDSRLLKQVWTKQFNCPITSSIGRLFDVAAALTHQVYKADFDGHAPMWLETIADNNTGIAIDLPLIGKENGLWESDWTPLITMLLNTQWNAQKKSSCFHTSLAKMLVKQVKQINKERKFNTIGLCGGVFQNRLLTKQAIELLTTEGYHVSLHQLLPCNDASLSYGQIIEVGSRKI